MREKILQIGNYPPPFCGWSVQTKLLVEEIRRRGYVCDVLNLGANHAEKSPEYTDVQNGFDYLFKLLRFASQGHRFQVHVNGQSRTGYILALMAALVGRLAGRPAVLSWRGGLQQKYFPRQYPCWTRRAYQVLFKLSGRISCNNQPVKHAIEQYGVDPERVVAIPAFSVQHLQFRQTPLPRETEAFLKSRRPVFFCNVCFRPEYQLSVLRDAMVRFRQQYAHAGFVWLGFPFNELRSMSDFVSGWPAEERRSLLLLGNLSHDEFLTLLSRSFAYIRTPVCDGVASSVLEALVLGIPVVASENGHRPPGVLRYRAGDAADLCAKLVDLMKSDSQVRERASLLAAEDNVSKTVDWLLRGSIVRGESRERTFGHVA
jgi:glycosyltransferase involved in cell wall biosynthesis